MIDPVANRKRLIENILSLGAVQLASYVLPFLSLPYLALTLGVDALGRIAFALSVAQIFVVLTDYGFNLSAPKDISVARDDPQRVSEIYCAVTLLRAGLALAGGLLLLVLTRTVPRFQEDASLLLVTYTMVLGNILFPQWLFQGLEQLKLASVFQVIARLLVFAGTFTLVHGPEDVLWAAWLQAGGTVLGGLMAVPFTLRALRGAGLRWPSKAQFHHQLQEGWHVFLSTAAINVYTSSNAFFLGLFAAPAMVGHYHVAEKLIRAVQMVFGPISNAVYPHVARLAATDEQAALRFNRRLLLRLGAAATVVTAMVWLLAPQVVARLFGPAYEPAVGVLRIFALLPLLIVASNILGIQTMLTLGMKVAFSRILLGAALVDFAVFIPAAYWFGAEGAAWANVLVELYVTVTMAVVLHGAGRSPLSSRLAVPAP
ncbi:PST family polysaccharide transporter [Sphaerotilus hippei]|uniref:PST family polysaccharide transporter n=1 Tax=Sphaerotilus hippei TaxID=744406 RepID=A0A318GYC4_9BURK|nr:PST family polysaccharide transporter [Sphaerotilus hippei]